MNRGVEVQYNQWKILAINSKKNCLVLVRSRRLFFDVRTDLTDTWEVGETIIRKLNNSNLSATIAEVSFLETLLDLSFLHKRTKLR